MVHQTYEIGGVRFGLRTTSESLGEWIADVFADFRVEGNEEDPLYSVVVADPNRRRPGKGVHILYIGTLAFARTTHLPTLQRALVEELVRHTYPDREDAVYLDALLLGSNGHIAILPPDFLPPLMSIRRRLERTGLRLGSSRTVALDPHSGEVVPPDLGFLNGKASEILAPSGEFLVPQERLQISSVIVPWSSAEHMFHHVSRGRGLYALSQTAMNLPRMGTDGLVGIRRLVENAACYETLPVWAINDFVGVVASLLGAKGGAQARGVGRTG